MLSTFSHGNPDHNHKQQHHHHIHLSTETVKRTPLTLERIDHIQTRHRLSLRVLGVGDGVTDDAFEESFQDTAGFFVDHCEIRVLCQHY